MTFFHRLIFTLVVALAGLVAATAQPRISYMLPDLGTTRFATYVEIVGPASTKGNFGTDGFYLNNAGNAVRVRCERPADTALVAIGPCVVSWNGRLVSTHFFVYPTVAPNSDRWDLLQSQFRIPIVVEVNGAVSNIDTFYIVKPFAFGDKRSDPNRVIGETTLGRRSKRGAMIVDSMLLPANASFTVSMQDVDANTPGNQAFLPFTLLAVGNITGNNGTEIHADAVDIDGGPGGGGGGGSYGNWAPLSSFRGGRGGNGYSGGGPGGYNNSSVPLAPPNEKQKPGIGSGEELPKNNANTTGSRSLNGLPGGRSTGSHENAGGGTGHPFGLSGDACTGTNTTCDPLGAYGGGSGAREGRRGGGGGFGTPGQSETGHTNGGRTNGNDCLVPLAGGSGAASGNPDGTGISSAGGGGGGAVSIHAQRLASFDVYARGSASSAQDVRAGSGSGGGVILGMRLDNSGFGFVTSQVGTQTPNGFMEGGRGRARYDARVPNSASYYVGPLTDTLTASLRDVKLSGDGDGSDLHVYVKGETGPWLVLDTISGYTGTWRTTIRLPGSDTLYFVAVGQIIGVPNGAEYVQDPDVVLSQSAWNIIRLFGPPELVAPTSLDLGVYKCPGEELRKTITITNNGESPLEISNPRWSLDAGFRIVTPTVFPDTIITNSSKQYEIAYVAPAGAQGLQVGRLEFDHNDTTSPTARPWQIDVRVDVRTYDLEYVWRGIKGDTLDVGPICVGVPLVDQITVTNVGLDPVELQRYETSDPALVVSFANLPFTVAPTLSRNLFMSLSARRIGPAVVPTLLYVDNCSQPDTIWIRFEGVASRMTLVGNGQFGNVVVGTTQEVVLEIRNDGTSDLDIPSIPAVNAHSDSSHQHRRSRRSSSREHRCSCGMSSHQRRQDWRQRPSICRRSPLSGRARTVFRSSLWVMASRPML
ncbi:MAG: choice-of-anchor D domain-containing protein [Ignavibacteriae bacterium]|nr:MAG: choice-of-anchor D domain-containing protein [Ignavibacteriota bacterium]